MDSWHQFGFFSNKLSYCLLSLVDASNKLKIHVSVRILTIKIRQWVHKNFCGYQISNKSDAIMFNIWINCWTAESIQMCKRPGICTVMLRPIYTIRLCRIQQAYDRPTTWLKTCTTIVTELWVWFTRNNSRCRPVVSLSYATKLYHVNRPLDIWTG